MNSEKKILGRRGRALVLCLLLSGVMGCGKKTSETASEKVEPPKRDMPAQNSSPREQATGEKPQVAAIEGDSEKTPPFVQPSPVKEIAEPPVAKELDADGMVAAIKKEYSNINAHSKKLETDTNMLDEGGGEVPVTLFWEDRSLRKVLIDARGSFDMLSYSVEGYFKDDKLIFVFYKETSAVNPDMARGVPEAWLNSQHRVYVNDGKIVRYLRKEERQDPDTESNIQTMANVPVRDPSEIDEITEQINEWFGAATMVSVFGNRGYPCCLTLMGPHE